jgi:O-antigen/teichoic acid export membrane protein
LNRFNNGILAVLAHRAWQAGAGLITLAFIAHFLSPVEQGYYYTFASLAALNMLLDMGLSIVLVQVAAHEFLGLTWGKNGEVVGPKQQRFLALVQKSLRWYAAAALLFMLAYPIGLPFFAGTPVGLDYDWRGAWLLLVMATSVGLIFQPALSIVEGSGVVVEVYVIRLIQGVSGAIAVWVTLAVGGGLYAVAMIPIMSTIVAGFWLVLRRPHLITRSFGPVEVNFYWRKEIWPMQWRLGVSWICGYFLTQIYTPLLFRVQNPVVAGQMGLTMTVSNMLSLLALVGMTSLTPALARAAGEQNWPRLDHDFRRAFMYSTVAFVGGAVGVMGIRVLLELTPYGIRFLSVKVTAGLLLAIFLSHVSGLFVVYLRAHRREPFMILPVITAVLTVTAAILVAPKWGAAGIVTVLVVVNVFLSLPVTVWLWIRLRRAWHLDQDSLV